MSISVNGHNITKSKHGIDTAHFTSLVASRKCLSEMQSGHRCYPLKSLICHRIHLITSGLSADTSFISGTGSLQGCAARL